MCRGLYVHRLLSTSQLWELFAPTTSMRYGRYVLERLEQDGYAGRVPRHGSRESVWFLTAAGVAATAGTDVEARRHRSTELTAAGPLQDHTLDVNEVGLCFARAARRRGDDCRPFSWRNETSHPLGPGNADTLIADAVIDYTVVDPRGEMFVSRFVELDRGSKRVAVLAAKLTSYVRLFDYAAGWLAYPRFPRVMIVLSGDGPAALERRLTSLCELAERLPGFRARPEIGASATTLAALRAEGPFGRIFVPLLEPDRLVDVLGR